MDNMYTLITRDRVIGRTHRLKEAIRLAQERTALEWTDVGIWRNDELRVVVKTGGEAITVADGAIRLAAVPDGFIDFDALDAFTGVNDEEYP